LGKTLGSLSYLFRPSAVEGFGSGKIIILRFECRDHVLKLGEVTWTHVKTHFSQDVPPAL
jgi:hypothetical protein